MAWPEKRTARDGKTYYRGRYKDAFGRSQTAPGAERCTSKREAVRLAREEESKIRRGTWVDPTAGKLTVDEYFTKQWLPNRILEINTRLTYEGHYRESIKPAFGHLQLRQVTPGMVQSWVTALAKSGLKPGTVRAKYSVLASMFDATKGACAVRDGYVEQTPCRRIDLPAIPPRTPTIYQPDEVQRLMARLDPWWTPLVAVDEETGVRWGELIALRPMDVDARGQIQVSRTIIEIPKAESGNGTRFKVKGYPKSRRPRPVAITPELTDYLIQIAKDRDLADDDLLFPMPEWNRPRTWHPPWAVLLTPVRTDVWPDGLPISRSYFRGVWRRAIKNAGVPVRRFHDLRASNISWLLAGGADVATVMQRAGHSQFRTTQRYTTALDDTNRRALDALRRTKEGTGS